MHDLVKAVNLLPDAKPRGGSGGGKVKSAAPAPAPIGLVLLLPLLAALAVAVLFVGAKNSVAEGKVELERVTAQKTQAEAQAAALEPYGDFASLATQRVQTVTQIANSRFDWEQVLRDMSRAIPENVTLSSIEAAVTGGASGTTGTSSSIAGPSVKLDGCTDTHRDVARLMSRLRNVQGVTRVSLAKSDRGGKNSGRSGSPGSAVSSSSSAASCGTGRTSTFAMTMYFENDATAAAPSGSAPVSTTSTGPTGPSGPTGSTGSTSAGATPTGTPAGSASPSPTATTTSVK